MKRILVTGGAGYIGSAVTEILVDKGYHPVVFDSFYWGKESLRGLEEKITIIEGDIRSSKDVGYALQNIDAVIHLAGIVGQPACSINPIASHTINVESTHNLINCMTDKDMPLVRDFIYCSSCSVYGNVNGIYDFVDEKTATMPLSTYAYGKLRSEEIIFKKAMEVPQFSPTVLRLTTIFGWSRRPRFDLVTNFFVQKALLDKKISIFGDGSQYRSLIHVADVADALVHALESPRYLRDRQVFHVGEESNNISIRDMTEIVKKYLPETEVEFLAKADTDRRDYRIACQKIKNALNWHAKYSIDDGIKEMITKIKSENIDPLDKKYRNNLFEYI